MSSSPGYRFDGTTGTARSRHRHAALQLATVILIVGRLIDYRNRWSHA